MPTYDKVVVDPGTNAAGWVAGSSCGVLVDAGLLRPKRNNIYSSVPGASQVIYMEKPVIYPRARQKAKPKDILKLTAAAGELAAIIKICGGTTARIEYLEPREWKGQVPDDILYDRIIEELTHDEIVLFWEKLEGEPVGLWHNVLDAAGLWLKVEGRL